MCFSKSCGLISRLTAKHSSVLACETRGGQVDGTNRVFAAALRSPKGNLTFIVLNKEALEHEFRLRLNGIGKAVTLHCYQVTEAEITQPAFKLEAKKNFQVSSTTPDLSDILPPSSITVYSTFSLRHSDAGVTAD